MGVHPKGNGKRGLGYKPLLESDIKVAQAATRSASEAARFLRVNYLTYKKYAQMYGLFDLHKNMAGRGIPRRKMQGKFGLDEILNGKHPNYDRTKLKERIIRAGYLPEACAQCGFNGKRVVDGRCPLTLQYKDGDYKNLILDNLQLYCYNCFGGDETFYTINGIKSFKETVGTTQKILAGDGIWREAEIKSFGRQQLQEVIFKPTKNKFGRTKTKIRHSVICTPTHTWFTNNRGKTNDLVVGDMIPFVGNKDRVFILEAWIRGFGFGDGTISNGNVRRAQIRLCGEKDLQWLNRFEKYGNCSISYPPSYNGDAVVMFHVNHMNNWKELPTETNPDYLASWIDGYVAADGSISDDRFITLSSQNKAAIEFVKKYAPLAELLVTGESISTRMIKNFGTRKAALTTIKLQQTGEFKVEQIVVREGVFEVYCAVEPITHRFILYNGLLTGNCTYLTTGKVSFKHLMDPGTFDKDVLDRISQDDIHRLQEELLSEQEED